MTYKELKLQIKNELKQLAVDIRIGKSLRKPRHYEKATQKYKNLADDCFINRWNFRHKHIIYCNMFNGTPYEKIEQPRYNRPDTFKLDRIRKEWESLLDVQEENVRTGT